MTINKLLAAAAATIALSSTAQAASVSYFFDSSFVDTGREAVNQRADLTGAGNTVTNFTGTSDAAWASALTGVDALVIAEQERGALNSSLSATTKTAIADFVTNGGNLAVAETGSHRALALLNSVFGTSFSGTSTSSSSTITAAGLLTDFGSGPGALAALNAVYEVNTSSLGSATAVYNAGSATSVFTFQFGAGNVTFMGYDWYEGSDPAWSTVQNTAVNFSTAPAVPLPASALLLLGGIGGLVSMRKKRKS